MIFEQADINRDGRWISMERTAQNAFSLGKLEVMIDAEGRVFLSGKEQGIYAVRLRADSAAGADCLILGDAWERAYGDLKWERPDGKKQMPWYFMAHRTTDKCNYGFGVKTLPNAMCFWQCDESKITLTLDVRNGSRGLELHGRCLLLCELVTGEWDTDAFSAMCLFCEAMCGQIRPVNAHIYGGNDWYCNYGDNSFEKILLHTKRIVECAKGCLFRPYMVVDDGWELAYHPGNDEFSGYNGGPWKYCNGKFGDMRKLAEAISAEGAIPGIWMRPLETVEYVPSEYALKKNGVTAILDPSHPKALEMIKEDIRTLASWGYKLIKHDFSTFDLWGKWGFEVTDELQLEGMEFYDSGKTTAQIIKELYLAIREAAGDDVLIMGCNTFSHLSAGIFEIQRTGDDTSGRDWSRTKKMGVNTLAFRLPQHKRFYLADADCVGITNEIPWEKNRQWLDVLAKSGTPLFVSIAEDAYSEEVKKGVSDAFRKSCQAAEASTPLDWMETDSPACWESVFGKDCYQW